MNDALIVSGEEAFYSIVKFGIIVFLFLYLLFSAIVIKQVRMMTETLEVGFEMQIKFIVFLHLILAASTFILSFILL